MLRRCWFSWITTGGDVSRSGTVSVDMNPRPRARMVGAFLFLLIITSPSFAERRRVAVPEMPAVITEWTIPQCQTVTGLPSVRFSLDYGDTAAANERAGTVNVRPHDLVVTDVANLLYAAFEDAIY